MEHTFLKNVLQFLQSSTQQVCFVYAHDENSSFYRKIIENEAYLRSPFLSDECKVVANEILNILEVNKDSFGCIGIFGSKHTIGIPIILKKIYKNPDPLSASVTQEHPLIPEFKNTWMNNTLTFLKSCEPILSYPHMLRWEAEYIYKSILGLTEGAEEDSLWAPVWEAMKIYQLRYEYIVSINAVELQCMKYVTFEKVKKNRKPIENVVTKLSPAVEMSNESSVIEEQQNAQIFTNSSESNSDLNLSRTLFNRMDMQAAIEVINNLDKAADKNKETVINADIKNILETNTTADTNTISKAPNVTNDELNMSVEELKSLEELGVIDKKVEIAGSNNTDNLVQGNEDNCENEDEKKVQGMLQEAPVSENESKSLSDTKSACILIENRDINVTDLSSTIRDTGDEIISDKHMEKSILSDEKDNFVDVIDKSSLEDSDIIGEFNSEEINESLSQESNQNITETTETKFNCHNNKLNDACPCNVTNIDGDVNMNVDDKESQNMDGKDDKNSCVTAKPIIIEADFDTNVVSNKQEFQNINEKFDKNTDLRYKDETMKITQINKTVTVSTFDINTNTATAYVANNDKTGKNKQTNISSSENVPDKLNHRPNITDVHKTFTTRYKPPNVTKKFVMKSFSLILDFITNRSRFTLKIRELNTNEMNFLLRYKLYDPSYSHCEVFFDEDCKQLLDETFKALKEYNMFRIDICKGHKNKSKKNSVLFKKVVCSKSSTKKPNSLLTEQQNNESFNETDEEQMYWKNNMLGVEEVDSKIKMKSLAEDYHCWRDLAQIRMPQRPPKPNRVTKMTASLIQGLSTPVEVDKAIRMMRLMGWQGGSLGVRGNGLTEPIQLNIDRLYREGLRYKEECTKTVPTMETKNARKRKERELLNQTYKRTHTQTMALENNSVNSDYKNDVTNDRSESIMCVTGPSVQPSSHLECTGPRPPAEATLAGPGFNEYVSRLGYESGRQALTESDVKPPLPIANQCAKRTYFIDNPKIEVINEPKEITNDDLMTAEDRTMNNGDSMMEEQDRDKLWFYHFSTTNLNYNLLVFLIEVLHLLQTDKECTAMRCQTKLNAKSKELINGVLAAINNREAFTLPAVGRMQLVYDAIVTEMIAHPNLTLTTQVKEDNHRYLIIWKYNGQPLVPRIMDISAEFDTLTHVVLSRDRYHFTSLKKRQAEKVIMHRLFLNFIESDETEIVCGFKDKMNVKQGTYAEMVALMLNLRQGMMELGVGNVEYKILNRCMLKMDRFALVAKYNMSKIARGFFFRIQFRKVPIAGRCAICRTPNTVNQASITTRNKKDRVIDQNKERKRKIDDNELMIISSDSKEAKSNDKELTSILERKPYNTEKSRTVDEKKHDEFRVDLNKDVNKSKVNCDETNQEFSDRNFNMNRCIRGVDFKTNNDVKENEPYDCGQSKRINDEKKYGEDVSKSKLNSDHVMNQILTDYELNMDKCTSDDVAKLMLQRGANSGECSREHISNCDNRTKMTDEDVKEIADKYFDELFLFMKNSYDSLMNVIYKDDSVKDHVDNLELNNQGSSQNVRVDETGANCNTSIHPSVVMKDALQNIKKEHTKVIDMLQNQRKYY